jgi:lauroyl/myristoyl acyltransferase
MLETVIIITIPLVLIGIGGIVYGIIEIVKFEKENKKLHKEWVKSMSESFMEEMLHHRNQIIQMIEYNYANKGGSVFDLPEDKRLRVDVMLKYLGHSQDEALDLVYKLFNKTEDK